MVSGMPCGDQSKGIKLYATGYLFRPCSVKLPPIGLILAWRGEHAWDYVFQSATIEGDSCLSKGKGNYVDFAGMGGEKPLSISLKSGDQTQYRAYVVSNKRFRMRATRSCCSIAGCGL